MSQSQDPPPITIAPPPAVRVAGMLVGLQALGLLVFVTISVLSGISDHAQVGEMIAQAAYFVVLALFFAAIAAALIRGRRWGRTPAIVMQILVAAIGVWLVIGSGQPQWGVPLILLAIVTGLLLVGKPATAWINEFPTLFGPEPDR